MVGIICNGGGACMAPHPPSPTSIFTCNHDRWIWRRSWWMHIHTSMPFSGLDDDDNDRYSSSQRLGFLAMAAVAPHAAPSYHIYMKSWPLDWRPSRRMHTHVRCPSYACDHYDNDTMVINSWDYLPWWGRMVPHPRPPLLPFLHTPTTVGFEGIVDGCISTCRYPLSGLIMMIMTFNGWDSLPWWQWLHTHPLLPYLHEMMAVGFDGQASGLRFHMSMHNRGRDTT